VRQLASVHVHAFIGGEGVVGQYGPGLRIGDEIASGDSDFLIGSYSIAEWALIGERGKGLKVAERAAIWNQRRRKRRGTDD
jgi:hypothetical protein